MADFVDSTITTEIVEAKDKLVTQSNRAETILDSWEATGNLVADAPSDGTQYARKDGEWTTVEAGTGDTGMDSAIYDPQEISADAFDRSNHTGTQDIDTITNLTSALNEKVEEAPSDGNKYVRLNEGWSELTESESITIADVVEQQSSLKGSNSYFSTQGSLSTLARGSYNIDAIGSSDQGSFPYEGIYYITVSDGVDSGYYDSGTWVTSATIIIEAKLVSKGSLEDDSVYGVYIAKCLQDGDEALEPISFTKIASLTSATSWGGITGTLADQADLQTEFDAKLEADDYTAVDVKTKYESNADTNAFTDAQVTKLAGIEDNAQANSFDFSDAPSDGSQYSRKDGAWSVVEGGTGGITEVNLGVTTSSTTLDITNDAGANATLPVASTTVSGLLSASDKSKLDGIESGAQANVAVSVASTDLTDAPSTLGTSGQVLAVNDAGTALEYTDVSSGGGSIETTVEFTENYHINPDGTRTSGNYITLQKHALTDGKSLYEYVHDTLGYTYCTHFKWVIKRTSDSYMANMPTGFDDRDGYVMDVYFDALTTHDVTQGIRTADEVGCSIVLQVYQFASSVSANKGDTYSLWMRGDITDGGFRHGWYQCNAGIATNPIE